MFEIKGKYTTARVYAEQVEESCMAQIIKMVNHEAFTEPVAIMPDTHAGKGSVIGFTMPLTGKVIPEIVGVDLGCGMSALIVPDEGQKWDWLAIDHQVRRSVPTGFHVHKEPQMDRFDWSSANKVWSILRSSLVARSLIAQELSARPPYTELWFREKCKQIGCDLDRAYCSPGTLGGGNHFIEVDYDELRNNYWLIVHSGSRKLGECVCRYWQKQAGKGDLAFLKMEDGGLAYLHDMVFAQQYASYNRGLIVAAVAKDLGLKRTELTMECVHNFVDPLDGIIRKGAISAWAGNTVIVPVNMAFGTIVGTGASPVEWNYSAPHGAGRKMSRSKAKKTLDLGRFQEQMSGVFSTSVCLNTLDEAPDAYKDGQEIYDALAPIVDARRILRPIWNMKDKTENKHER